MKMMQLPPLMQGKGEIWLSLVAYNIKCIKYRIFPHFGKVSIVYPFRCKGMHSIPGLGSLPLFATSNAAFLRPELQP